MGAEYEHLKKASEALWHYQRVPFSVSNVILLQEVQHLQLQLLETFVILVWEVAYFFLGG